MSLPRVICSVACSWVSRFHQCGVIRGIYPSLISCFSRSFWRSVAGAFGARRSGGVQAGLFAGGKAQVSFHSPKKTRPARSHWSHLCQSKTGKQKEIRPKSQPAVDSATGFSLIIVLPLNLPGPIPYRPLGKVSLPPTEMKNHHFSSKTANFPLPF